MNTTQSGGAAVDVLRGIDLKVRRGEFLAITGPSGSGKSTLLLTLAGIDRPAEGTVAIDGVDLAPLSESAIERFRLERTGFVFQQPHLVDGLTVRENALLPVSWRGSAARRRAAAETDERLERLGIAELANRERDADALVGRVAETATGRDGARRSPSTLAREIAVPFEPRPVCLSPP